MKKVLALVLAMLMVVACVACTTTETETTAAATTETAEAAEAVATEESSAPATVEEIAAATEATIEEDPYANMTADELYEAALAEGGTIMVYSTSKSAGNISEKLLEKYPGLSVEYTKIATADMEEKVTLEAETGNVTADVVSSGDNTGSIYFNLVSYDLLDVYYPASIVDKFDTAELKYGIPFERTYAPWFYNTEMYPDGEPIQSWWDIVEGYNVDTCSFTDANGNNTQYWTIFSKDITSPSYTAQWSQLILDGDKIAEQYKAQYGEDLVYTYMDKLQNVTGVMELPENNAGVELFYRFSQMVVTELDDGDAVVQAVHESLNGPTLGLASAGKLELRDDSGYNIAWCTQLQPYCGTINYGYYYVTKGCDNPAGARLWILFALGLENGTDGCYKDVSDELGKWSCRSDVTFENSGCEWSDITTVVPDTESIYYMYPNVNAYWKLWHGEV